MADYIDREAAIAKIKEEYAEEWLANDPTQAYNLGLRVAEDIVCKLPSADVKPVVRCENCVHWNGETHGCTRNPSLEPWWESDFCNYWEKVRKE